MADKKAPDSATDAVNELKNAMRAKTAAQMRRVQEIVDENARKTKEWVNQMRRPLQPGSPEGLQHPKEEEKKPGLWERIKRRLGQA